MKSRSALGFLNIVSLMVFSLARLEGAAQLDPELPVYERVPGVSGNLNSVGSDTLNNMMAFWAEAFQAIYPNVKIQIEGKGSATAPPALIAGMAQIGPMSREMKSSEKDAFTDAHGYPPTQVIVGLDALAVFVHKDNPLEGMTMQQVDSIFSNTSKRGGAAVTSWNDLGLSGSYSGRAISAYGRNSASGTYAFFKDVALKGGDFKSSVKEQPGSSAVVQGIASDPFAVGYSGIGYKTSGVKSLALTDASGSVYFHPTFENAISGDYPLARFLFVYVNKRPNAPLDTLTFEFLRFVHSKQGQEVVMKDGYYPLPASVCAEVMDSLSK